MRFQTAGFSALLALAANAILLPPDLSIATPDASTGLLADSNHRVVQVKCAGCPLPETHQTQGLVWLQGVENSLLFEIDTGAQRDVVRINGAQLFPPTFALIPEPIYIHQVPSGVDTEVFIRENPHHLGLRVTQYEFRFDAAETVSEEGNELMPMTLTIGAIAGLPIPSQSIRVFIVKDTEGHLGIAHIDALVPDAEASKSAHTECERWPMLCRLKDLVSGKIQGIKTSLHKGGCHKSNNSHATHSSHGDSAHSHHHSPHGASHHRHGKFHRFMHKVAHVLLTIFVPVLTGVFAGIATYLVGMVLGATVALIWLKLRRQRSQYQPVALDEESASVDDGDHDVKHVEGFYAKEAYLEQEIAEVEAPPAYTDASEKEVVEFKN